MSEPVVEAAEQHLVLEVSRPASRPVNQVMALTPGCGPVASRPDAALVTHLERFYYGASVLHCLPVGPLRLRPLRPEL